jgi:phasin
MVHSAALRESSGAAFREPAANGAAGLTLEESEMAERYEIPTEMRDFAERSVAQARKAFEGFMGAVHKTSGALEGQANPAMQGARDISTKAVSFAETNVNAAFDLAERLVHAKDVQEVLAIQAEYLKSQMEAIQTQTRELGDTVQKATGIKK